MDRAVELAGYVNAALFVALAVVASYQWIKQRSEATGWFAATFLVLAAILTAGLFQPDRSDSAAFQWLIKVELAVLVLFPYFLYRFMGTFLYRPRWVKALAVVLTGGVIVWTFLLPSFPGEGDPRPPSFDYWLIALLAQWSILSLLVTVRLWIAGRGQPSVARTRMRLLSIGAFGITAVLILSGTAQSEGEVTGFSLLSSIMSFLSGLAFFFGFAPPAWMRIIWRRPESESLQRGISSLMASRTPEEVGQKLLPHVVRIIGARGAALVGADGGVIATHGLSEHMLQDLSQASPAMLTTTTQTEKLLVLPFEFGTLVVWASPYTPFFGREEVGLITSLGALTDVAMERAFLFRSVEQARQELEGVNSALGRREAMLAEAQKISRIGSWEWDAESGRVDWSDQMYEIYGLEIGESQHLNVEKFLDLVHPEDRGYVRDLVSRALEEKQGFQFEHRIVQPSGDVRVLNASGKSELDDRGEIMRMFGVSHDITDRKESERALADAFSRERLARVGAERANSELETFVYTVSHDLNSPLISVLGYIDLFETDFGSKLPEEAGFYLQRIKASTGYMQSLIKDLLELSRVGRVQTEPDDVDLDLLIDEITNEIHAKHPDVAVEVPDDLPDIHMNPLRARQLFANLLQNSVKYAGRPDVRIEVRAEDEGNGLVTLSVADNGPGISYENRERVFGVFERLETSEDGTGIGLAVCKRIVETSGGRIWIADSDLGTDMRVSIPRSNVNGSNGRNG